MLKFSVLSREKKNSAQKEEICTEIVGKKTKEIAVYDGRCWPVVSCGNLTINPEDSAKQITNTILSIVPPDEKTKRNPKHSLAISTSFGHVHAFLNEADSVWNKLEDCESKDQCLMLIKKPRSSAKQMLKAHSWANLSVSDSQLYSQLDGTLHADSRKHHKYRMKRKQSDLQLVPERRGQIENWIQEQNAHLESRKTKSDHSSRTSLPATNSLKYNEINNNEVNQRHSGPLPKNMVPSQRLFSSERNLSNFDCNSNIKSNPKRNDSYSEIRQPTAVVKQFNKRAEKSEKAQKQIVNNCKYGPPKPPRLEQKKGGVDSPVQYSVREITADQKHSSNVSQTKTSPIQDGIRERIPEKRNVAGIQSCDNPVQYNQMERTYDQKHFSNVNQAKTSSVQYSVKSRMENRNMPGNPIIDNPVQYIQRERTHMPETSQKQSTNVPTQNGVSVRNNVGERFPANRFRQDGDRRNQFEHPNTNPKSTGTYHSNVNEQGVNLMRVEKMCDNKNYSSQHSPSSKTAGAQSSDNLKSFVPVQPYRESNLKNPNVPYSHYQNRDVIFRNSEYGTFDRKYPTQPGYNNHTAHPNVETRRKSEGNYRMSGGVQNLSQKIIANNAAKNESGNKYQENGYQGMCHNVKIGIENEISPKTVTAPHLTENFSKGSNYKLSSAQNVWKNTQKQPIYELQNQVRTNERVSQKQEKSKIYSDTASGIKSNEIIVDKIKTKKHTYEKNSQGSMQLLEDREDNQIKSDELYNVEEQGVISKLEADQEPVMRSHSMGDLTAGLTFSLVGQLKAESMLTLPVSTDLDKDGSKSSVPSSSNQSSKNISLDSDEHREIISDSVTKFENEKSVNKPRRSLPQAPANANQKKKRYTELMQMKIRSASSRNTQSSPQSSPEMDSNVNETPLDQEVSELLRREDKLGHRLTPQELPPTDNNKNGRHISMKAEYTSESPQVRHLSGDSVQTTRASHGSTVDSGYLTNDQENDFYSTSSYTLSIQRSAQNIYSRVQDENGVTREVTPRQYASETSEQKSSRGSHHYENCYSVSRAEPVNVPSDVDEVYSQNVPKHKRVSDPCMSSREKMVVGVTENTQSLTNLNVDAAVWSSQKDNKTTNQYTTHRGAVHEHHFQPIRSPESSSSQCTCSTLPSSRQYRHESTHESDTNSVIKNASLFLILQKYRLYPVRINLPKNCSLFEFVHLQDDTVGLPLLRNSPTDQLLTSTPRGKYATLGGPGSAFKPVKNKSSVTTVHMVTVAQVTEQLNQLCDVGDVAENDLIVELDGQLVIGANLTTLKPLIQRSGSTLTLTVARKCPEFTADVSVITESKDTMVLEKELVDMRQKMASLTTELQIKDKHIQQLTASLPQYGNKNYFFPQQNGSVLPTDSFLNGLDEDEFIV